MTYAMEYVPDDEDQESDWAKDATADLNGELSSIEYIEGNDEILKYSNTLYEN